MSSRGTLAADGTWTASPNLGPGVYNVTARATDVAGNQGAASAAIAILVL